MPPEKFSPVGARDVFLVTYPRSGTTWISCIAAELQFHRAPKNLTEISSIVPDVHDLPAKSAVADADRRNVTDTTPESMRKREANERKGK